MNRSPLTRKLDLLVLLAVPVLVLLGIYAANATASDAAPWVVRGGATHTAVFGPWGATFAADRQPDRVPEPLPPAAP